MLHYDDSDSIFIQIAGVKEVTLVPVKQLAYIYPYPRGDIRARRAHIDIRTPDRNKFPLSALLKLDKVTLHPGDMLLVPRRSGHETVAASNSTTLTFRLQVWCS